VYSDTVTPQPGNLLSADSNGLDIYIGMTNAALLSGTGFEIIGLDHQGNVIRQSNMTLLADDGSVALVPCLANGCLATATLNLVYLDYIDSGSGTLDLLFDPSGTRALMYRITDEYHESTVGGLDYVNSQPYYVAVVPLPATVWLLGSGVAMLGGRMRRLRG
jgi:hypothetical protein